MDKCLYVNRFKAHLLGGDTFSIKKDNEFQWRVESRDCRISFVFDRYGEYLPIALVSSPKSTAQGTNVDILGLYEERAMYCRRRAARKIRPRYLTSILAIF